MHPLFTENPALAHLAHKNDTMHKAADGALFPSRECADLHDAGHSHQSATFREAQKRAWRKA